MLKVVHSSTCYISVVRCLKCIVMETQRSPWNIYVGLLCRDMWPHPYACGPRWRLFELFVVFQSKQGLYRFWNWSWTWNSRERLCCSQVTVDNLTYMQPFSPIILVAHSEVSRFESAAWNALSIISSAVWRKITPAIWLCIVFLIFEGRLRDLLEVVCVAGNRWYYTCDSKTCVVKIIYLWLGLDC